MDLTTERKHFQMLPALFTWSRLPESPLRLHIDHWIVTNDSSGLGSFFNGGYELSALESDSCDFFIFIYFLFPLKADSP